MGVDRHGDLDGGMADDLPDHVRRDAKIYAAPLCGAGSGAPRAGLCVGTPARRPRRPSHSSATNLGGSIGSPVMSTAQGRLLGFDCPARGRRSPGICACEDDGQDQVLSGYILLQAAKLVAPRSVRARRFVSTCQRLKADEAAPGRSRR